MTHTKHRKRRERATQQEADQRLAGYEGLLEAMAFPLLPRDAHRTGRAG